jgi:hypothetical protein
VETGVQCIYDFQNSIFRTHLLRYTEIHYFHLLRLESDGESCRENYKWVTETCINTVT